MIDKEIEFEHKIHLQLIGYLNDKINLFQATENIKSTFKEAGYLSHDEVQSMLNTLSGGLPEIVKIQGYVKGGESQ